jgi:hypothetical protein
MSSTIGRRRLLTDAHVALILKWRVALMAWKAQREGLPTQQKIAQQWT